MKILFFRYGSIVEPYIRTCLEQFEMSFDENIALMRNHDLSSAQIASEVAENLRKEKYLFVFSVNFFPEISDVCEICQLPYVCWTVDSPFLQLFSKAMHNSCNRIFFFDRKQYETFGAPLGAEHGFYLPLAGSITTFETVIKNAAPAAGNHYKADISMVGSLYKEKDPYRNIGNMPDYLRGYAEGLMEAQLQVCGYNFMEEMLTDEIMAEFSRIIPDIRSREESMESKRYKVAHFILGAELTYRERVRLLNALAERFAVDLYTLSDTSDLQGVHVCGQANSSTEMPLIFHESKINLNITMRPIMTGLSQRVYDVLACGGFLLSNYQEELPQMFEIGTEVECFSSQEELCEKADFYLRHETLRCRIAERGQERLRACHTFEHRIREMLSKVLSTM